MYRFYSIPLGVLLLVVACTSTTSGPNRPPIADAGPDMVGLVNQPITLNGSGSYDPDGDKINYQWEIAAAPAGASLDNVLSGVNSAQAVLTPSRAGIWLVKLTVSDGRLASTPDIVEVRVRPAGCEKDEDCQDGVDCTRDRCTSEHVCENVPDDSLCTDDGIFCNGVEYCDEKSGCQHRGDPCSAAGLVCNEEKDTCAGCTQASQCDDKIDCTLDDCDVQKGLCTHLAQDSLCPDDQIYCNGEEFCDALHGCSHRGNPCTGQGICDEENNICAVCGDGVVSTVAGEQCDPGEPRKDHCCRTDNCRWVESGQLDPQNVCDLTDTECTDPDTCDGQGGCQPNHAPAGAPCGDQNVVCHNNDTCDGRGNCIDNGFVADGTECGSRSCVGGQWLKQTCQSGECSGSEVIENCADTNECTQDLCNAASGCYHQPVADDTPCTSNNTFCDGQEVCRAGQCTSPGNPCPNPADCDEQNDRCGACGDGVVSVALGEECDPGAPKNDHCCDPGTCKWVPEGSNDPQNYCSGASECERDVCGSQGTCSRVNKPDGAPCGDQNDTICDNPDTCLHGVCQPNYEPSSTVCRPAAGPCDIAENCTGSSATCPTDTLRPSGYVCRPEAGPCDIAESCTGSSASCPQDTFQPAGYVCRPSAGPCDIAENCTGSSASCPQDTFQPAGYVCRPSAGPCDIAESCTGSSASCPQDTFQPAGYVCRPSAGPCDIAENCTGSSPDCPANTFRPSSFECRPASGECDVAENCTGSSADCPSDQYVSAGTLCLGTDGEECNSTCDGAGNCVEGQNVPDWTPCDNSNGICCQNVCEVGWSCCAASDCDDNNQCTLNQCIFGTCDNPCSNPSCMKLNISSPVAVNTPAPLTIEMCPENRDTGKFVCFSNRNHRILVEEHFETGFGDFVTVGNVTRQNSAQNPNTPGSWGVRICNNDSVMRVNLNTTGRKDIAVIFSMANSTMANGQTLAAYYSPNGGINWRSFAMVGDNLLTSQWQNFAFILPPEAENNPNLVVSFYQRNGNNGNCAFIDDVYIVDLLPFTPTNQPLFQTNFDNLDGFVVNDPQGNDVNLVNSGTDSYVQIKDHQDAYIELSEPLDTTNVNPYNLLIVEWEWRQTPDGLDNPDDYVRAEITLDGTNWIQLSTTGVVRAPDTFTVYRVILPCQAFGTKVIKVGFVAPSEASNLSNTEGIEITRLSIYEAQPQWVDQFAPFRDEGNGIYTSSVTSGTSGTANVTCRYGCGASAIWSNSASVTFTP